MRAILGRRTRFDNSRWVADGDHAGRNIAHHHGPRADDGIVANCNAGSYEGVCADPYARADGDGQPDQREFAAGVVVCAAAKVYVLRDGGVFAYAQRSQVVDLYAVAEATMSAHLQ